MAKKATKSHRELIDTGTDKRFVRRDEEGQFEEVDDVGRSLARDRQQKAKTMFRPVRVIEAIRNADPDVYSIGIRVNPWPDLSLFNR